MQRLVNVPNLMAGSRTRHAQKAVKSTMIFSSDEIRSKSFAVERKGYNKVDVDSFLERVADNTSKLLETERSLRAQLEEGGGPATAPSGADGSDDFAAVGEEVTAVLRAARESAEAMRSGAESESRKIRRDAEAFAAEHRGAAETAAAEIRAAAALEVATLRQSADRDRADAEKLLGESRERAAQIRADAEEQAAQLVATAKETAEAEYEDAVIEARGRLEEARAVEQEIMYSLTAVHSDVGVAIARLDQDTTPPPPPVTTEPDVHSEQTLEETDQSAEEAAEGGTDTTPGDSEPSGTAPETELERTSRQVTGGLAESLRESAGVSGPVGALFGLTGTEDTESADSPKSATPSQPEEIDLRDQPDAVEELADSDDPLADLVKQAVGKAVERAAEETEDD